MSLIQWSMEKVRFILSHVEELVEEEVVELRKKLAEFESDPDLHEVAVLHPPELNSVELPRRVFEKLAPFYEAGLLLHRDKNWSVTDFFWRGQTFSLQVIDRVPADHVVPLISPVQVHRAPALPLLGALNLDFIVVPKEAMSFLFKPTEHTAYILISNLPELWSGNHVESTLRLLNGCFDF